ncbi:MAG: hypothetical protein WKF57_22680 [Nakamurella sp.]
MDTYPLHEASRALLEAAEIVAAAGGAELVPPSGEWDSDQILAHVSLVNAATLAALSAVAAGAHTTYDNRIAQDGWTIGTTIRRAGGAAGLRTRIRVQTEALCTLGGSSLSDDELNTAISCRLLSHGDVLLDQPISLRDILNGLAQGELPGHTAQLLALLGSTPRPVRLLGS